MKINLGAFAVEALSNFQAVGAIAPSSRYLAQAMLRPLPAANLKLVVELGPGTGVMTRALLNVIPPDGTLWAFETNRRFCEHLESTIPDPRLVVINADGETVGPELRRRGYQYADAIVSSLALGFMSEWQRHALLNAVCGIWSERTVFTQYQYFHGLQLQQGRLRNLNVSRLLHCYFRSVQRQIVWCNLPPAYVFACRGRRDQKRINTPL